MSEINEVYALCFSANYKFAELQDHLLTNQRCVAYRDVLHVELQQGEAFIFSYGVLVFWQLSAAERDEFVSKIEVYAEKPLVKRVDDEFTFESGASRYSIKNDHIILSNDAVMTKLAVSHGLAQSIKLAQFELRVQEAIDDTAYIPQRIAQTGKTQLSRKQLAKLRGHLFITKSDIMLHYDLLDKPEFFWDYPELENYYVMVADYLEVKQRLEVLSKKLETIHELFQMMADEQNHKHSSLLEWIIIYLIAFEIVVFLVHDIFQWT